jgi:catechol 2,3-dioxygenase-like lactoylglutathione lyase family enzyme
MKIKYITVFTDDVEKQVSFFCDGLGFEVCGKKNFFPGRESILLRTDNPDVFIAVVGDNNPDYPKNLIILSSHDCLSDYHTLKLAGVVFHNEPQYLPVGLGAEFCDPAGNHYLLLEERSYHHFI